MARERLSRPAERAPASPVDGFRRHFGCEPTAIIRAPGRVNLIGEHTDYNGLPVLPFAIGQSHRLAAAVYEKALIELVNEDPRYSARTIAPDELGRFSPPGEWDNYLRAALLGLIDARLLTRDQLARGLRIFVSSDLPSGVGLSSSSALVVGFALAALHVWRIEYDRRRLADVLAEAEHYVGTRGGGMDQTVCLLGQAGHALRIDFFPLRVEAIPFAGRTGCQPVPKSLARARRPMEDHPRISTSFETGFGKATGCQPVPPEEVAVFLSDSGVRVEKSGAGLALYNRRPTECRLALALFQSWARHKDHVALTGARYWGDLVKPPIALSHAAVLELAGCALKRPAYRVAELCRALEISEEELQETYFHPGAGEAQWEEARSRGLKLRRRVEHVIAEARRVEEAVAALRQGDWPRLAGLIAASHASCRDLYEISCPALERLVEAGREAGAPASRLTGAGFGGCVLHLVRAADAGRFEAALRQRLGEAQKLFRVAPAAGAEVVDAGPATRRAARGRRPSPTHLARRRL